MTSYYHKQRAPLCWALYGMAAVFLVLAVVLRHLPAFPIAFPCIAAVHCLLAASFHYLAVSDQGERLLIGFGPLPLFNRTVRYDTIRRVEVGQTKWHEGWGIHVSLRGGWVWNLWGWDCVVLHLPGGPLRVGTDDASRLADFLQTRINPPA